MRRLSLILSVFISIVLIAQEIMVKELIQIETKERNKKSILLVKKIKGSQETYLIQAKNQKSKDFSSCQWESVMNKKDFLQFSDALTALESDTEFEHNFFRLRSVRDKVYVYFNHTKCKGGHKTHYFQKKCSRLLSFVLSQDQVVLLINSLEKSKEENFVKNDNLY